MSRVTQIRDFLRSDATLVALLTGGIWQLSDTGRNGLDRRSRPEAFDGTTGVLKPTAVLRGRGHHKWGGIDDITESTTSGRQVLEIYFYDDGDRTYNTIESARSRVKSLLHYKRLPGISMIKWFNNLDDEKAEELNEALMIRGDYEIIAIDHS